MMSGAAPPATAVQILVTKSAAGMIVTSIWLGCESFHAFTSPRTNASSLSRDQNDIFTAFWAWLVAGMATVVSVSASTTINRVNNLSERVITTLLYSCPVNSFSRQIREWAVHPIRHDCLLLFCRSA